MSEIIDLCRVLNKVIHDPLYYNFYFMSNDVRYTQTFVSIDLIEDSQIAIEEFKIYESSGYRDRSTLLIYGLLQSLFLQQDGLHHLYQCVVEENIKLTNFFDTFDFDKSIRDIRNDIAGHPTNRNGKESYYIEKGSISKYLFTYVGYNPGFRKVEVDLEELIAKQLELANKVLNEVLNIISKKIEMKKVEHKNKLFEDILCSVNRNIQLIYRGVNDKERGFQANQGIAGFKNTIYEVREELNARYNDNIPSGISESLRLIEYIISRLTNWQSEGVLLGNNDAEIFLDSLDKQLCELSEKLREIEEYFNDAKLD